MQSIHKKSVLVLIGSSIGELEWVLPALHKFHSKYQNIKIHTFILSQGLHNTIIQEGTYIKILESISSVNICILEKGQLSVKNLNNRLAKNIKSTNSNRGKKYFINLLRYLIEKYLVYLKESAIYNFILRLYITRKLFNYVDLDPKEIGLILKDNNRDTLLKNAFQKKCKHAKVVSFPHTSGTHIMVDKNSVKGISNIINNYDIYLVNDKYTKEFRKGKNEHDIKVVGVPRYNKDWIRFLISYDKKAESDFKFKRNNQSILLFLTRPHDDNILSEETYSKIIIDIINAATETGHYLLIKPHPRDDLSILKSYLNRSKCSYSISLKKTLSLVKISDIVVGMYTSALLDAHLMNKPVIEYYFCEMGYEKGVYYRLDNGSYGSFIEYLDLAMSIKSFTKLVSILKNYKTNKTMIDKLSKYKTNFENFYNTKKADEKVAEIFYSCMK